MGPMADEKPSDSDSDDGLTGESADEEAADEEMADEEPTGEEPAGVREPESDGDRDADIGETTQRRPLRRSTADRVIAGVAGGVGDYFGIDPVIVRIAFIVLTFLGGAGAFLYLLGWLALPGDNSPSVIAKALGGDSPHRFRSLAAVALIGLGLLMAAALSEDLFRLFGKVWTAAPYLALMLIAVGVALVVWPGPARRSRSDRAQPPTPLPAAPSQAPAAQPGPVVFSETRTPVPTEPSRAPTAKPKRKRSVIGPLTIAVLLIYMGATVIFGTLSGFEFEIGEFFAIALVITGLGLVIAAFAGPARGLIPLGVVIVAPVLLFSGTDVGWGSGVGEVRVNASEPNDLTSDYRHNIGRLIVDLRDFDADGSTTSLGVSVGMGEALIYVPDNLRTIADVKVGAGGLSISDRSTSDRSQDLRGISYRLEELQTLPFGEDDSIDSVTEYLDAYESYSGHQITRFEQQILDRWLPDQSSVLVDGGIDPRDVLRGLLLESMASDRPREVREYGLGLTRRIEMPPEGGLAGELRLDIDIGIGRAELITGAAPTAEDNR